MLAQYTRQPEVGNACGAIAIDQYVALHIVSLHLNAQMNLTYAFQICVYGRPIVEVFESTSDIRQL